MDVDHYIVLGLPSGEEGAKLTEKEISKAYKQKALELHPDKRPDDPDAVENFQKLKSSYEILKDEKARKLFDDLLRVKREQQRFKREQQLRNEQQDVKRRKKISDLEDRERAASAADPDVIAREETERISRKLNEEIARIRAMHMNKGASADFGQTKDKGGAKRANVGGAASVGLEEKEKMLKVSWEKFGEDYSAKRLREIFSSFGKVEDVVIKTNKKKGSALVVMGSKEAAVAATGNVNGSISNPLLVLPLQPALMSEFPTAEKVEEDNRSSKLAGAGYQAYEDAVLQKLKMAAKRKN